MSKIKELVDDGMFDWLKQVRRKIHANPELGFEEYKTAGYISNCLRALGVEHQTGVAKTGVVGWLKTSKKAPTVAIRADMDALPIEEQTGLSFSSKVVGKMHACGHDGHVTIALGACALLKKAPPAGNVVFIFQPAEETDGGAHQMITEGALDGVDVIYGGHIDPHFLTGEIAIKEGITSAYTDSFDIEITAKGGHAARPHEAIDGIIIAAQIILQIQTIVSRQIDPFAPAVITIGELRAGHVYNAIAQKAYLKGTIRTIDDGIRKTIMEKLKLIVSSFASMYGVHIDINFYAGYPPVINHKRECGFAYSVAQNLLGQDNIKTIEHPSLGGEDFSFFVHKVPGCFVRYGARSANSEFTPVHSPFFIFDEEVLRVGAAYMAELIRYTISML